MQQRRATYAVEPSILVHGASSLAEVRGRVVDAIGDFVGQLHTNLGRAQLISAAPGAGKSTAVAKSIRKHRIEARIVVGTKALAQELAEDHLYNLIVGRNHTNCDRYDVVKRLGESGHRVEALACGTPFEPRCPFFSRCRYFAQFHAAGPRVAATEQLFNPTFLAGGELAVVDDAELPRALIERWTVTGAVLERAVGQLSERGDPVLLSLLPILQHAIIDGPNEVLTGAHVWDQLAATTARYDQDSSDLVRSLPVRNLIPEPEEDKDGYLSVRSVEAVPPATIALVLGALKQELPAFERGEDFNSGLALSRTGIVVGRMRQHAVDRKGRTIVEQMGMLVLDATPLHVLVDYLCATHERLPDVDGDIELPANVTVVQYASSTNGHSVLTQEKRVQTVVAEIAAERLLAPVADLSHEALITYKEALPLLGRAGFATDQMISFGAMRGTNAVENVRRLHMVGRPMPPTTATHYLAQIIHHDEPYVSPEVVIDRRQFAGQAQAVEGGPLRAVGSSPKYPAGAGAGVLRTDQLLSRPWPDVLCRGSHLAEVARHAQCPLRLAPHARTVRDLRVLAVELHRLSHPGADHQEPARSARGPGACPDAAPG